VKLRIEKSGKMVRRQKPMTKIDIQKVFTIIDKRIKEQPSTVKGLEKTIDLCALKIAICTIGLGTEGKDES
jgi:hypothetical protein